MVTMQLSVMILSGTGDRSGISDNTAVPESGFVSCVFQKRQVSGHGVEKVYLHRIAE